MLTPDDIAALLQKHGSGVAPDDYDEASESADANQNRTELLKPVLETCEESWASGSEVIDLIAQKLGDGSRDGMSTLNPSKTLHLTDQLVAWRIPYGNAGILDFFLRVLATGGLRQALQIHSLRLIGNSCADTDENRARLVQDNRLETVIRELQDESLIPFTIPVLFNILVDYGKSLFSVCSSSSDSLTEVEPAQLLASQSGLSSRLIAVLSSPNISKFTPYITYFCKILALLVGQEGEPTVADPNTVPVLLKLATDPTFSEDVEDFVSLISVAAAYLGSEEAQEKFVKTPEVALFLSAFQRVYTDIDNETDDEDLLAQFKQLRTSLLGTLASLTGNDSFFVHHPLESPVSQALWKWLEQANPHLQAAGCLALGNLARSDEQSIALVQKHQVHKPLISALSNPQVSDTQLLHSALSFLKNLAIPVQNKTILRDLLDPICVPRIYTLDTIPQVQFAAVSLTRLLLVNCPSNVQTLCAPLPADSSTASDDTSVHGIISLFGRSDAEPTRLEAARSIAAICRALHSTSPADILPDWKPVEGQEAADEGILKRQAFYNKHKLSDALAFLVTQPKWPIIRSEAWFVFALMSRSKDGAAMVTSVLENQDALDALSTAITGREKDQASAKQIEAAPAASGDIEALTGGLSLEPQQVDPSQKANMTKIDRENAVVLCTELLRTAAGSLPEDVSGTLHSLVKEGAELVAADKTTVT